MNESSTFRRNGKAASPLPSSRADRTIMSGGEAEEVVAVVAEDAVEGAVFLARTTGKFERMIIFWKRRTDIKTIL